MSREIARAVAATMLREPVVFDAICPDCGRRHKGTSQFTPIISSGKQVCFPCLWERLSS